MRAFTGIDPTVDKGGLAITGWGGNQGQRHVATFAEPIEKAISQYDALGYRRPVQIRLQNILLTIHPSAMANEEATREATHPVLHDTEAGPFDLLKQSYKPYQ